MKSEKEHTLVIAVAAVSGGGKTTMVRKLADEVPKSRGLYFDGYDFNDDDIDLVEFARNNGDYNIWNLDPLVEEVNELQKDENIEYIFIDYPFAYQHESMKNLLDIAVFIDTPLDIALARRVLREENENDINEVFQGLEYYLTDGRQAYEMMLSRIKPDSDLVIDGTLDVTDIVTKIMKFAAVIKKEQLIFNRVFR